MSHATEISLIMSVYNGEDYLAEAIESVINQTFEKWELIIINDCSTDGTCEILKKYSLRDSRIKVHTNEVNLRLPASLNKALSISCGKYIARMDADDICLPDRLEKQYKFMEENPDIALSSCRFMTLKNGAYSSGGCGGRCDNDSIKALLLVTNPILHPGIIAKAEVIKNLKYDATLTCTEDLELWVRMAANNYKIEILPEYLMIYRLHEKQITETTLAKQHKEVVKIEKKYFESTLSELTDDDWKFYIEGIYFRENINVDKFIKFYHRIKKLNRKKQHFKNDSLDYAFLEILAEYKRYKLTRYQLIKALANFNPLFLSKELINRKKRAYADGLRCIEAAKNTGLKHTAGEIEFPVFSRIL